MALSKYWNLIEISLNKINANDFAKLTDRELLLGWPLAISQLHFFSYRELLQHSSKQNDIIVQGM